MHNIYLVAAIISEVIATSFLKDSKGFTALWPSLITMAGYAAAFYFLSLALEKIPLGVAYAIWCGVGIVLITIVGLVIHQQTPDKAALLGIALIGSGVVVIQGFSESLQLEENSNTTEEHH